jgi:DNA-binding response OmpR family regulator
VKRVLVLVVDDDEGIVEFIASCLKTASYEVLTANNGRDGCQIAVESKPDVIILDLMMPDMHGFEVCQKIRENETLKGVKVIISSGKSYAVDVKSAMRLGADAYLTKPYSAETLLEAVKKTLEGQGPNGS